MAFRCAFRPLGLLPIALLVLGTLALLVPWRTCGPCGGAAAEDASDEPGWSCSSCRDAGRVSLWSGLTRRRPAPSVERVAQALLNTPENDYYRDFEELLAPTGLDRGESRALAEHAGRYVPTDEGERFVLLLVDSFVRGAPYSSRPVEARCLLFDLDGTLLDHLHITDDHAAGRMSVYFYGRADAVLLQALLQTPQGTNAKPPDLRARRDRRLLKEAPEDIGGGGSRVGIGLHRDRFVVR